MREKEREERQQQVSVTSYSSGWVERAFSSLPASLTGGGVIFMNAFPPSSSSPTHEKGRMTEEAVFFSISHAIVTSKMMTFASHASVVLCAFLGCRASIKFPNLCLFVGTCGVRSIASPHSAHAEPP